MHTTGPYEPQQASGITLGLHFTNEQATGNYYWKIPGSRDIHEHWEGALGKTSTSRYSQAWESQ